MFTQTCLILLLYGTLCGGLAFLSDVSKIMILKGVAPPSSSSAAAGGGDGGEGGGPLPPWLWDLLSTDGRPVMVLVVLLVLFPLCMQRHIREVGRSLKGWASTRPCHGQAEVFSQWGSFASLVLL